MGGEAISEQDSLILILILASLMDLQWYKVSNGLIVPALVTGLISRVYTQGIFGTVPWLMGVILPMILCSVLYLIRALGASDVKLFSVIGSFVTWQQLLAIMAGAVAAGAVMALGKMWMRRNMSYRFRYFFMYLYGCIQAKKLRPYYQLQVQGDEGVIPFCRGSYRISHVRVVLEEEPLCAKRIIKNRFRRPAVWRMRGGDTD